MKDGLPKVGDKLIHPNYGLGEIVETRDTWNRTTRDVVTKVTYLLRCNGRKSTIGVPLRAVLPMIHAYNTTQKAPTIEERLKAIEWDIPPLWNQTHNCWEARVITKNKWPTPVSGPTIEDCLSTAEQALREV